MKLYVGNTTKQVIVFNYRVPEQKGLRVQDIPVGGQVLLSGDLNQTQIDSIIDQHAKYGMVRVDEIDRTREFIGLCYDVDHEINVNKMILAMRHNTGVLIDLGKKIRQEAAIAENNRIEAQLDAMDSPLALRKMEVSLVEETTPADGSAPMSEGTRVDRNAPQDGRSAQAPRRRKGG